jgi:hypothetical protein
MGLFEYSGLDGLRNGGLAAIGRPGWSLCQLREGGALVVPSRGPRDLAGDTARARVSRSSGRGKSSGGPAAWRDVPGEGNVASPSAISVRRIYPARGFEPTEPFPRGRVPFRGTRSHGLPCFGYFHPATQPVSCGSQTAPSTLGYCSGPYFE